MNTQPGNRARWIGWLAVALMSAGIVVAGEARGPGWVDSEPFLSLAGEDNLEAEVSVGPALMRLIGAGFTSEDPELASTIKGLERIYAAVVTVDDPGRRDAGRSLVRDTEKRLQGNGWERIARVRDEDADIVVLILPRGEQVNGLVVMIMDKSDGNLVFVNIAGSIDLAMLEKLSEEMDIPGMESVDFDE